MEGYRLITARFTDQRRTAVEALWTNNGDTTGSNEIIATTCIAEETDAEWRNLCKHIEIEQLHINTSEFIAQRQYEMQDIIMQIAKKEGLIYDLDQSINSDVYKAIVKVIFMEFDSEKHKEQLFFLKLQLFEQDFIKNSKDKELKKKLRKATSIMGAVAAAIEIFETSRAASSDQPAG